MKELRAYGVLGYQRPQTDDDAVCNGNCTFSVAGPNRFRKYNALQNKNKN